MYRVWKHTGIGEIKMKEKTNMYIYTKRWRKQNPDKFQLQKLRTNKKYNKKYPSRICFANKIYQLLKQGKIEKKPCVECGSTTFVQAVSMSNVYDPLWLCDSCNKTFHKRIREQHEMEN